MSPTPIKTLKPPKRSSPSPKDQVEKVPPPPANFTELLMITARAKQKVESRASDRTPVKVKIKRFEEKAQASGATG